jgi:uncharacterized protein YmfQ (DUF2313 family)
MSAPKYTIFGSNASSSAGVVDKATAVSSWSTATAPGSFASTGILAACYGNGLFIVGGGTPDIGPIGAKSVDTSSWSTVDFTAWAIEGVNALLWDGSQYIASSGGQDHAVATSPDGTTWTPRATFLYYGGDTSNNIADTWGLAVSPGGQRIVVANSGQLNTSPDGQTWTHQTVSTWGTSQGSDAIRCVCWDYTNSQWVIAGEKGQLATSPDGATWTMRTSGFASTDTIWGLCHIRSAGRLVAVGTGGKIFTSSDGISWTQRAVGLISADILFAFFARNSVTTADEVAFIGGNASLFYSSTDGITWTARTVSSTTGQVKVAAYVAPAAPAALTATDLTTAAAAVGPASGSSNHSLTATNLAGGAAGFTNPHINQTHVLTANDIAGGAAAFGTPTVTLVQVVADATSLATGAAFLDTPSLDTTYPFGRLDLTTDAAGFDTPALTTNYTFTATSLATAAAGLGTPSILNINWSLHAQNIASGDAFLGAPGYTTKYALLAEDIATSSSGVLQPPNFSILVSLSARDLVTGPSVVEQVFFYQTNLIMASGIRHDQSDYWEAFSELRPQGVAWPRDPDSAQMKLLLGMAGPWGNEITTAADTFLAIEAFPPTSVNLLPEWEQSFGLPDKCLKLPPNIVARHDAIIHRMTLDGSPSREFLISEGLWVGYEIQIREHSPFICGISQCGDTTGFLNPDDPDYSRWELGAEEIRFTWTVNIPAIYLMVASDVECILNRYKPAHTDIYFNFAPLDDQLKVLSFGTAPALLGQPTLTPH